MGTLACAPNSMCLTDKMTPYMMPKADAHAAECASMAMPVFMKDQQPQQTAVIVNLHVSTAVQAQAQCLFCNACLPCNSHHKYMLSTYPAAAVWYGRPDNCQTL